MRVSSLVLLLPTFRESDNETTKVNHRGTRTSIPNLGLFGGGHVEEFMDR